MINPVVNNAGISLIPRLLIATTGDPGAIVAAYLSAEDATGAATRRQEVLGAGLDVNAEHQRLLQIEEEIERAARALLGAVPAEAGAPAQPTAQSAAARAQAIEHRR